MNKKKYNELIKVAIVSTLCLGLFAVAFAGVNQITLAAATEGTQPLPLPLPAVNIPAANVVYAASAENQKPDMAMNIILGPDTLPGINAISPETAAEIGARYIWDMFGESIDGTTVKMFYSNHPAFTRASWIGRVLEPEASFTIGRNASLDERMQMHNSTLFTFSIDAVTGERIDISTHSHWAEISKAMTEEIRNALDEFFSPSQRRTTEEAIALRSGGAPPAQLDGYIKAAREHAQRHFHATEVISAELKNINALTFALDENGNLIVTDRQLIFEVTDSTGRVADIAIIESTKQLIWLHTGSNDIVPGWNYVGEEPGLG